MSTSIVDPGSLRDVRRASYLIIIARRPPRDNSRRGHQSQSIGSIGRPRSIPEVKPSPIQTIPPIIRPQCDPEPHQADRECPGISVFLPLRPRPSEPRRCSGHPFYHPVPTNPKRSPPPTTPQQEPRRRIRHMRSYSLGVH
jgi:hypothetical protein